MIGFFYYEYTLVLNLKRCLLWFSWRGLGVRGGGTIYGGDTAHRTWILLDFSVLKEGTRFNTRF